MRRLIESRLAARAARSPDLSAPSNLLLRNVVGPVSDELRRLIEAPGHAAAVLLALVERKAGWTVVLTERSRHLSHHAGQISLPGGRIEHGGETAVDAALREAWEEIGLSPAAVEVAGCLDTFVTGTGFVVTPVVGFVDDAFEAIPNAGEVHSVFEVPLERLLAPDAFSERLRERLGSTFRTYELHYGGHLVWGATAAMLVEFRDLLNIE